ncbi:hypothetical protein [Calothrix sp. UHCC 0171]|nr:hypothetical protein [Calothrix sp. UHCC 0171]MEA5570247.1 hypothetical protein [Calothrix sp. UHCC 0171]
MQFHTTVTLITIAFLFIKFLLIKSLMGSSAIAYANSPKYQLNSRTV